MKKLCKGKCNTEKDLSEFGNSNRHKDGKLTICKSCRQAERRERYANDKDHRDNIKQRNNKSYENHKDTRSESYKKKYSSDEKMREDARLRSENQRKNNPEKTAEYKHTHYLNHKEDYLARAKNHTHVRRAACKDTDITNQYLKEEKLKTKVCPLCGCELNNINIDPNQYNLDHIIPLCMGGKHLKKNVRYICRKCNLSRKQDGSDLLTDPTVSQEVVKLYLETTP